ncbi:tlde1 domain-containing protein [Kosakonia sp. BYX6]|uniref:Tlde1 domain-containing protein n=1 Tax=Kosakonia calanthes TaxID=3139408 RepID=A0ABZ3B2H1_9ENTR
MHLYKNHHSQWFGLYNAQTMSDHVYVNGTRRGSFRLHPFNGKASSSSSPQPASPPAYQCHASSCNQTEKGQVPSLDPARLSQLRAHRVP